MSPTRGFLSFFGNMGIAIITANVGRKQQNGSRLVVTHYSKCMVHQALQKAIAKRLYVTSSSASILAQLQWSDLVLPTKLQRIIWLFSLLLTRVSDLNLCYFDIQRRISIGLEDEGNIALIVLSCCTLLTQLILQQSSRCMQWLMLQISTVRCCFWPRKYHMNQRWRMFFSPF